VAGAKGIGAESAFGGLSAYAAELVLTLFVFFHVRELVLELVSPYRGWDEFPEFARGAFLSRPAHEFPEFPEFAFQRRLGGLRREPAPDLVQKVASLPL
jgi:hypothetical protein